MYKIYARSSYGTEQIDEAKNLIEARYLVNEYKIAYGSEFTIFWTWKKG